MTDKKEEILNKDDITQLHGAQLLATKDGLLNEAKKHADISQLYADSQAKERAVGFHRWCVQKGYYPDQYELYGCNGTTQKFKQDELYTEYEIFTNRNDGSVFDDLKKVNALQKETAENLKKIFTKRK